MAISPIHTAAIKPSAVASGVGVWMAAIRKNSTPTSAKMSCKPIGTFPFSFGPIYDNDSGRSDGSFTNKYQTGTNKIDANTALIRIQRMNVPAAGVWRNSSACSKWSKYVVGSMMTFGDVSTIKMTYPDKM